MDNDQNTHIPPLENLGRVNEGDKGFQELFRRGGEYIVVSTVANVYDSWRTTDELVIGQLSARFTGTATSGEETMAFRADEKGEITNWVDIAVANGPGSREDVLEQLQEGSSE